MTHESSESQDEGKQAIVTGASRGIGEAITRRLAARGMTVTMVGRDEKTLQQAADRIRLAVPDAELRLEGADLSLVRDVRALADRLASSTTPSVVINNAAVTADTDARTDEGHQLTLATNHLAPYVLMRTLAESVTGPARFVVVGASPTVLKAAPVDLHDLQARNAHALSPFRSMRPFAAYARTKNMNTMFVYSLARRLSDSGITVNGAHPGVIARTGLSRDARGLEKVLAMAVTVNPFKKLPDEGADNPVWVATDPALDGVTGRFFVERKAVVTPAHTLSPDRCDALWERTAELVGMDP